MTSGFAELSWEDLLGKAAEGVPWVFPGAHLRLLPLEEARGLPDRGLVRAQGAKGYGGYFPGPPRPVYLLLEHPGIEAPEELRLAALFLDHLLSALRGAGFREELLRQARTDWLTGLANRRAFSRQLESGLPPGHALILMDLDGLKEVNDREGHLAGDALLKRVAKTLGEVAQACGGKAFRLGGDEFALILPRELLEGALRDLESLPLSVGVALAEEAQGEALYALADERMYGAKARRKGQIHPPSSSRKEG
ncbi:GGDEF domain-containing protein [Thermus sp. LT1-2-5]|uniref:GGDEF domain-containing protein n=1 Tax=Thermus sp. LT1-2-5 TaxID=3026935 RepID=UPI0030E8AD5F